MVSEMQSSFVSARILGRNNLKKYRELIKHAGKPAARWGRRFSKANYLPGLLEDVWVSGYMNLPRNETPAPILAFSHKKFFDVQAIVSYMLARPLDRFHDFVVISQAGIHSGVYPYKEFMPAFLKNSLLNPLAIGSSKLLGALIKNIFTSINTYPVYRGVEDIPESEAVYEGPDFGGKRMLGLSYADYLKFASKETRRSVMRVFQDMEDLNRSFVIAPEGLYCHDGSVQPLHDFMGIAAHRKQRNIILISISYDELCPDSYGRTAAYIHTSPGLLSPENKSGMDSYIEQARHILRECTPIVASQIIATILESHRSFGEIKQTELLDEFHNLADEMSNRFESICAPNLVQRKTREEYLVRFLKSKRGRQWLMLRGDRYKFNKVAMAEFDPLERTVDWLRWNSNQLKHRLDPK